MNATALGTIGSAIGAVGKIGDKITEGIFNVSSEKIKFVGSILSNTSKISENANFSSNDIDFAKVYFDDKVITKLYEERLNYIRKDETLSDEEKDVKISKLIKERESGCVKPLVIKPLLTFGATTVASAVFLIVAKKTRII